MSSENLNNLSIKDLKKLVNEEYKQNKKLRQDKKKEKLIRVYKKLQKQNEKLRQEKQQVKSVVIILHFLTQNPCTPPYKTPVISLSFLYHHFLSISVTFYLLLSIFV